MPCVLQREELHKRVRELMSEMQGLKSEKAAWTRDANRASMLEQARPPSPFSPSPPPRPPPPPSAPLPVLA